MIKSATANESAEWQEFVHVLNMNDVLLKLMQKVHVIWIREFFK